MSLDPAHMDVLMGSIQINVKRVAVYHACQLSIETQRNMKANVRLANMELIAIKLATIIVKMDAVKSMDYAILGVLPGNLELTVSETVLMDVYLVVFKTMVVALVKQDGRVKNVMNAAKLITDHNVINYVVQSV
ncbi:uncharacterized protein LOC134275106 [Saccostrea cucullata]|uniref:uncharacterized protein LOC134275106 n=1 Tax=Saccostrea cuccullata TaxID=36930 RepID=UPI002ED4BF5E